MFQDVVFHSFIGNEFDGLIKSYEVHIIVVVCGNRTLLPLNLSYLGCSDATLYFLGNALVGILGTVFLNLR